MVGLMMVPHRGVPVAVVRISKRHRGGSERGYDEDSKSLLENEFHVNSRGSKRVSDEKRDAVPRTTAMRAHSSGIAGETSRRHPVVSTGGNSRCAMREPKRLSVVSTKK
jgi:hypothetical protein